MRDALGRLLAAVAVAGWAATADAQHLQVVADDSTTYRVFLTTGEPLPSYGEPVFVDDRVIFNLLIDPTDALSPLQLVNLPLAGVDRQRTARYTEAMRAAHYARTRGEADYQVLTTGVERMLSELRTIRAPRERLDLTERVRRQLISWPAEHFHYRADEVRSLARLVDGVISELRAAVGEQGVTLDLLAGRPAFEALIKAPTLREAIALALRTAELADNGAERVATLRGAVRAARRLGDPAVTRTADEMLAGEQRAGAEYGLLIARLRALSDRARARGDVAAQNDVLRELQDEDVRLGRRRPADVQAFRDYVLASRETTRLHEAALEEFESEIGARRRYARRLRPLLDRVERERSTLSALREQRGIAPQRTAAFEGVLAGVLRDLVRLAPPPGQVDVQAVFRNAVLLAQQAVVRRRLARSSQAVEMREASSAAAGALLLLAQVRDGLETSLRRPSIR